MNLSSCVRWVVQLSLFLGLLTYSSTNALSLNTPKSISVDRRQAVFSLTSGVALETSWASSAVAAEAEAEGDVTLFKLPSGLKYIELKEGSGPAPRYGNLLSIKYTGYIKLENKDKQKFDSNFFLVKHGNGRNIAGLDEGLHTMKEGGVRRLIIPPKLGYVDSGLGPIPAAPWSRWRLNSLLKDLVAVRKGNLVFDVELLSVIEDEADQGYYDDESLTPEEFDTLRTNLQEKAANAAKERGESPESDVLSATPTI